MCDPWKVVCLQGKGRGLSEVPCWKGTLDKARGVVWDKAQAPIRYEPNRAYNLQRFGMLSILAAKVNEKRSIKSLLQNSRSKRL